MYFFYFKTDWYPKMVFGYGECDNIISNYP